MSPWIRASLSVLVLLLMLAPAVSASPSADYFSGCTGEYFNNITLTGTPVATRTDAAINFTWPAGTSPAAGINTDNYSARWTCSVNVTTAGTYTINVTTDDGMNVIVDGNLVVWAFYDQGPTAYSNTVALTAGVHTIKVEYYNKVNGGTAQVSSDIPGVFVPPVLPPPPPPAITAWQGEYFNNPALSGAPVLVRNDAAINFNWGLGSPAVGIPVDGFSVRWTRTVNLAAGTYRFTATVDDGIRLWIDSTLLIDRWIFEPPTTYIVDIPVAADAHVIKMEYFENAATAVAQMSYVPISAPPPPPGPVVGVWVGQYYNNISLSGSPVYLRNDTNLNFNWGETIPAGPGVPLDNWSAKWDAYQNLSAGDYTIIATSDDGVRVWIDGVLAIDGWSDHPPMTFTATRTFTAGLHAFHVEYYDRGGGALVSVQIVPGSTLPPPPPPTSSEIVVDDRQVGWQAGGTNANWHNVAAGIGGHSFFTLNNTYAAPYYNWARWYPALPAPGNYEVFAYIPSGIATTLNARYWVYHSGRYDLSPRSQVFYADQWVSLGTFNFSATGGEFVSLSDVTYECYLCKTLAFDAVKFVPR
jgi:hypothetical protein